MSYDTKIENIHIRHEAWKVFHEKKWRIIGLTVVLYAIIAVALVALTALANLICEPTVTVQNINGQLVATSSNPLAGVASLLAILLTIPLNMGYTAALIALCRGEDVRLSGLFSRMGLWLKGLGLFAWVWLKTMAWAILGALVMSLLTETATLIGDQTVLKVCTALGVAAMCAFLIPAALRYSQATFIMADDPGMGIRDSVNLSKGYMKGRKWQYVRLGIPYFLKYVGVILGGGVLLGVVLALLGDSPVTLVLATVLPLVLLVIALALILPCVPAYTLFYIKRADRTGERASYWTKEQQE